MEYSYEDIDKVVNFKTWSEKKKIDELFRIDCYQYTNLGKETTKTEREVVRRKSKAIYKAVTKINQDVGKHLLYAQD